MQKSNNLLQDAFETAGKVQDLPSPIYCDLLEACCYLNFLKVYFHHAMAEPSSSSSHELGILGDIEKMGGSSWSQRGQVKTASIGTVGASQSKDIKKRGEPLPQGAR